MHINGKSSELKISKIILYTFLLIFIAAVGAGCISGRGPVIRVKHSNGRTENIRIERYVEGVLAAEVPSDWPMEALKAQAVASRTFVMFKLQNRRQNKFDVYADIRDQSFKRKRKKSLRIEKAVKSTRGEILIFNGKIAEALFHSSCGGYTANSKDVFGGRVPYLRSVKCGFCGERKKHSWIFKVTRSELSSLLKKRGIAVGRRPAVRVVLRDFHGRAVKVAVWGGGGRRVLGASAFRSLLGYNRLKSTFFDVEMDENSIVFTGYGWGHGVGMCQWGARCLAEKGRGYRYILGYYYPGTVIRRLY